jgi:hypothetical protein
MEAFELGDQAAHFDRAATRAAYASLEGGDAERCGCAPCRNFALQRAAAYPLDFRALLDRLGIDPLKEGEAVHYGGESLDKQDYGGWFYFIGTMPTAGEYIIAKDGFSY